MRYAGVSIGLHWLTAVLIVVAFGLGWISAGMEFVPRKCAGCPGTNGWASWCWG
jgi:cytochrome b561